MGILSTTLITSGSATLIAGFIGIPVGAFLASRKDTKFLKFGKLLVRTFYGLPPVVVGIWVYLLLSKEGILSQLDWLFTIQGMILAQVILILPLVLGFSWFAFERIEREFGDVIKMVGPSDFQAFKLKVNLAKKGVMQGIALGFGRAIAEVGAVLMVGGNIAGQTRVMTTSIVLETSRGNLTSASFLGIQLLVFSMVIMIFTFDFKWNFKKLSLGDSPIPKPTKLNSIKVENLNVEFDDKSILENISFDLKGGEVLVILGESGAGKSTILKSLAGLIEYSGSITGVPSPGLNGTVMVFQEQIALTKYVAQQLSLASYLHGLPNCAFNLLKSVKLDKLGDRQFSTLSSGEKQRVIVLSNLAFKPALLLLDEFTASLDGKSIEVLEKMVNDHRDAGGAAIIVTHNANQAKRLGNKILYCHRGKLIDEDHENAKILLSGQWSG